MIKGEYKTTLMEVFEILGFTSEEKDKALETFKKKLAFELLGSIQAELPQDQQDWLNQSEEPNIQDAKFSEIQETIKNMYSEEQLYEKSGPVFKKILGDYISFMSEELDELSREKLNQIAVR